MFKYSIIILFLFFIINCPSTRSPIVEASKFRIRCMRDSCYILKSNQKIKRIKERVKQLFECDSLKYYKVEGNIITDGKYYSVRLFDKELSKKICDSLELLCWRKQREIYGTTIVSPVKPPCLIEGCCAEVILDSNYNIVEKNICFEN